MSARTAYRRDEAALEARVRQAHARKRKALGLPERHDRPERSVSAS